MLTTLIVEHFAQKDVESFDFIRQKHYFLSHINYARLHFPYSEDEIDKFEENSYYAVLPHARNREDGPGLFPLFSKLNGTGRLQIHNPDFDKAKHQAELRDEMRPEGGSAGPIHKPFNAQNLIFQFVKRHYIQDGEDGCEPVPGEDGCYVAEIRPVAKIDWKDVDHEEIKNFDHAAEHEKEGEDTTGGAKPGEHHDVDEDGEPVDENQKDFEVTQKPAEDKVEGEQDQQTPKNDSSAGAANDGENDENLAEIAQEEHQAIKESKDPNSLYHLNEEQPPSEEVEHEEKYDFSRMHFAHIPQCDTLRMEFSNVTFSNVT